MPLLKKIDTTDFQIGIWKVVQSEFDTIKTNKLSPNYHPEFLSYKSEFRKWQIHAVKLLYGELDPKNELITKKGIPYLKKKGFVSISHTKDIVAIITANYDCGIDIEKRDRNTSKIKHKFINSNDFSTRNNRENFLKIWCMKEVLYKIKKDSSLLFKDHLFIEKYMDGYIGICQHPRFSFQSSLKILNFENYFLAFNTNYCE